MTRNLRFVIAAIVLGSIGSAAPAHAQPVEIGVSVGRIDSWFAGPFSGGDARVTIPTQSGGDVEILVGAAPSPPDRLGFYAVQYRRPLEPISTPRTEVFLTFGGGGFFSYEPHESFLAPPLLGFVGVGFEQRVLPRLAVRVDAQGVAALVIPAGVRVAAGVSVPIGRVSSHARAAAAR